MYRIPLLLVLLVPSAAVAQIDPSGSTPASQRSVAKPSEGTLTTRPPDRMSKDRGLFSYIDLNVNTDKTGHALTSGFGIGYQFNRYVVLDSYLPHYYLSVSTTSNDSTGATQSTTETSNGIGDPSIALRLSFPNRIVDYRTRVTTWIPVTDIDSGFTTESALVDWTSHFSRPFGRWLPFGQVGIANTVPDTPLFFLPYMAQGFNARFEGGANISFTKIFSSGASFYYVLPSGKQTLYSRKCHGAGMSDVGECAGGTRPGNGQGSSGGNGGGNQFGFMTQQISDGYDITQDHGVAAWVVAELPHSIDLRCGYSHSYGYALDTFSFGVGFDPLRAFGRQ